MSRTSKRVRSMDSEMAGFMLVRRSWFRRFSAKSEQHRKGARGGADRVRMVGRQMNKRAGFEPLPFAGEEKITRAVENLHEGAAAARVRCQFLAVGKREKNDAHFGTLQQRAA